VASDRELAQQTQEKFQFYVLALNFTLLAAAIQTARFGAYILQDWLELIGWLGLLSAGIVGLWKIEWSSPIRVQYAKKADIEAALSEALRRKMGGVREIHVLDTGQMEDIEQRILNHRGAISYLEADIKKLDRWDSAKYIFFKCAFLFGVVALMAARGCYGLASLLGYQLLGAA
jgi:hypothetical protein